MTSLVSTLQALELELHHPGAPCDAARLEQLLHPDFHEVGRSGLAYDRATVLRYLSGPAVPRTAVSDRFVAELLAPGIALLSYRSAQRQDDGTLATHTQRSSVWVQVGAQWQVRYHQGTPAGQAW